MNSRGVLGLALVLAVFVTSAGRARADEADGVAAAAADAKARGDDALERRRPDEALAAYEQSYALQPNAAVLYNIGRAHQALGNYPDALERLEEFAATAPESVRARVPGLAVLLAEVKKHVAQIAIAVDTPGATVKLGARVVGTTPLRGPVRATTGATLVTVEKEGYFPYAKGHTFPAGLSTLDVALHSKLEAAIVVVRSPVIGAKIAIDGRDEGTVPTEVALKPGAHRIHLSRDGYRAMQTSIAVAAGQRAAFDFALEPEEPITKKWWFWTGVGAIAAGVAVTVFALTTERDPDRGSVEPGRISTGLSF